MEDVRDLKESQLDAMREVANIGAGHAATALSQMTNRTIMITVPRVNVRPLEDACDMLGTPDEVIAAILMHMMGDLTGRALLLFPERSAAHPVRLSASAGARHHPGLRRDGAVQPEGGRKHSRPART